MDRFYEDLLTKYKKKIQNVPPLGNKIHRRISTVEVLLLAYQKIDELIIELRGYKKATEELGELTKNLQKETDAAKKDLENRKKQWEIQKHVVNIDEKIVFLKQQAKAERKKQTEATKECKKWKEKAFNLLAKLRTYEPDYKL